MNSDKIVNNDNIENNDKNMSGELINCGTPVFNRTERLVIFNDTVSKIKSSPDLQESIKRSIKNTKIYPADKIIKVNKDCNTKSTDMNDDNDKHNSLLFNIGSIDAALHMKKMYPDKKVGVLNFASATNPGGGVTKGANAQEESLCRVSTLYDCLNSQVVMDGFYNPNRESGDSLHTDTCIYTPDVAIIKNDRAVPLDKPVYVDVISCSAPNLRDKPSNDYNPGDKTRVNINDEELLELHIKRINQIFRVAIDNNIDILIVGAFGCGAFKNNPRIVAKAFKVITDEYINYFRFVITAIPTDMLFDGSIKNADPNYMAFFDEMFPYELMAAIKLKDEDSEDSEDDNGQ